MNVNGSSMGTRLLKQMRVSNAAGHFKWSPLILLCVGETRWQCSKKAYDVARIRKKHSSCTTGRGDSELPAEEWERSRNGNRP